MFTLNYTGFFAALVVLSLAAPAFAAEEMVCFSDSDETKICAPALDLQPTQGEVMEVNAGKASGMVRAEDLNGQSLDLVNEFTVLGILEEASLLPLELNDSGSLALGQALKAQRQVRLVEDFFRNEIPGTQDPRVSISNRR